MDADPAEKLRHALAEQRFLRRADEAVIVEFLRLDAVAPCQGVTGRRNDRELLPTDDDGPQAGAILIAQIKAKICRAALDQLDDLLLAADADDQLDIAMLSRKFRQQWG